MESPDGVECTAFPVWPGAGIDVVGSGAPGARVAAPWGGATVEDSGRAGRAPAWGERESKAASSM